MGGVLVPQGLVDVARGLVLCGRSHGAIGRERVLHINTWLILRFRDLTQAEPLPSPRKGSVWTMYPPLLNPRKLTVKPLRRRAPVSRPFFVSDANAPDQ